MVNHIACSILQEVTDANNVLDSLVNHIVNHIACSILQGVAAANAHESCMFDVCANKVRKCTCTVTHLHVRWEFD